ncbi:MAG: YjbE family putative metal transport protein [Candidatus Fonsibacter sp.]|nr:YjbE family putative metal transport protein [Candidatus Fonsibacter sp.]
MEFITEEVRLTIKIILIDMILSADNAIVIGLAAAQFDPKIRKKVVLIGTALAVIFRLFFALSVAYFLQFKGVRTFGGILLFYIAYKLYEDIIKDKIHNSKFLKKPKLIKEGDKKSFRKALITIIIADLTISFDNVIAIAGAAKSNYTLLVFGLILSVILMISLANAISIYLRNNRWVAWLGILSILWVAVDLILYDFKLFF